jgi:exodeoxyribonuclease VII large subunit
MKERDYLLVRELNEYVRLTFANNPFLKRVNVRGEVLNYSKYKSAHYFTLKDEDDARIQVVLFYQGIASLNFPLKDGDDIIVTGEVTLYEKSGTYQLIGSNVILFGEGQKLLALKKLKEKLEKLGIFDESKKLPLKKYPRNIGVICGKDSAAWADIKENITLRYPLVTIYYFPAIVQGETAPKSLIAAYNRSLEYSLDVLIIARGGGSSDDLWAFNDEELIMLLSNRKVPIISAVGHEIDFTLLDFLADLRVSTPTAAAEAAVPNKTNIIQSLIEIEKRLTKDIKNKYNILLNKYNLLANRPIFKRKGELYAIKERKVNDLRIRLKAAYNAYYLRTKHYLSEKASSLTKSIKNCYNKKWEFANNAFAKLEALSPLKVLERGYSMLTDKSGHIITSIKEVSKDDMLFATLKDGKILIKVEEIKDHV